MTDERTPVEKYLEWLPVWWNSVLDITAQVGACPGITTAARDQAAATQRDVWDVLGVDLHEPEVRHALAVGLAYGGRWVGSDTHAARLLAVIVNEWGSVA